MKHWHHIIPKHAGGSDDPSNLIQLTIKEHAEAHKILFETYGRFQDEIAWKLLSGMIGKEDAILILQINGGKESAKIAYKNGTHNFQLNNASNFEHVRKLRSERMKGNNLGSKRKITEELKNKLALKSKGNTNVRNTKWWNNGSERKRSKESPGKNWIEGFKIK